MTLTAGVVAGSQENTTGSFPLADDMAGGGCGQDTILADEELLDAICRTNFGNQLDDLGVPKTAIATNDEERACVITSAYLQQPRSRAKHSTDPQRPRG